MAPVEFHIDHASWRADAETPIGIFGWGAWRDGRPLTRIVARVGGTVVATAQPFARDDVTAALERPSARQSGFNLLLPFLELEDVIHVAAEDGAGNTADFFAARVGDLPNKGNVVQAFTPLPARVARGQSRLGDRGPPISVLVPLYNTPPHYLSECVDSVLGQKYENWELCLVDDASDRDDTRRVLEQIVTRHPRIRFERSERRAGISGATNRALALATGDYVVLLDHDDRLLPHALETLANSIIDASPTNPDVLYSDEEKITETGDRRQPVLKPAFSPEFLRGVMYVGHVLCVHRTVALEVGGFDTAFDGIQDFEFLLRVSEKTRRIVHVPEILYQWRLSSASSALAGNVKGDMDTLQMRAVEAHFARAGRRARVRALGNHRVTIERPAGFVRPHITLFLTPAASTSPALIALGDVHIEIADVDRAISATGGINGELVAYLGEPILDASPGWLDELAFLATESDAGRVSPVVRSTEGKVLESGRTSTPDGRSMPLMRGFDPAADGYNGSLRCHREVLLASPECWIAQRRTTEPQVRRYDRVCATAWIRVSRSWVEPESTQPRKAAADHRIVPDPFFNPGFDAHHADYRLGSRTS